MEMCQPKSFRYPLGVTPDRLDISSETTNLTRTEKAMESLGILRILGALGGPPKRKFTVEIQAPKVIQIEHAHVPFKVRVVPRWDETHRHIRNKVFTARLTHFSLLVRQISEIEGTKTLPIYLGKFRGTKIPVPYISPRKFEATVTIEPGGDPRLKRPLAIPVGPHEPLRDAGEALGLRIPMGADPMLVPDFETENIKVTHKIGWEMTFDIEGKTKVVKSDAHKDSLVVMLGPSNVW